MPRPELIAIPEAPEGERVRIAGTIELRDAPLRAPLSDSPCVLYEVYDGLQATAPRDREAQDFFVRDALSRALIATEFLETELLGHLRREQVALIEANIQDVSAKLGRLKSQARGKQGPSVKALHAEMRTYKRVATYLCASKAQARGRVHGGMTKDEQKRFLARETKELDKREGGEFVVDVERAEALLTEGQHVEVTGRARWVRDPSIGGVGYRDVGKALVVQGSAEEPSRLTLAASEQKRVRSRGAKKIGPPKPPRQRRSAPGDANALSPPIHAKDLPPATLVVLVLAILGAVLALML